jgi:hypothetical protein
MKSHSIRGTVATLRRPNLAAGSCESLLMLVVYLLNNMIEEVMTS